jgi:hypothetical protein
MAPIGVEHVLSPGRLVITVSGIDSARSWTDESREGIEQDHFENFEASSIRGIKMV